MSFARAVSRLVPPVFGRMERGNDDRGGESRAVLARMLLAVVWLPIQITLSLLFATGGLFLLLILGMVLAPFVGGFFLIRHLVRRREPDPDGIPPSEHPNGSAP